MTPSDDKTPITDLNITTTKTTLVLHVSGGIRAQLVGNRVWSWFPVLKGTAPASMAGQSIEHIRGMAEAIGCTLFGGDEISGLETALPYRVWTPLHGPHSGTPQPADAWASIAHNAIEANDQDYAAFARHIAFSLRAAGSRIRDASDHYHAQLMAAIASKRQFGARFSNIAMSDLQLAFHSITSELCSARDYLAASLGDRMGAPEKIDAFSRLDDWTSTRGREQLRSQPVLAAMLSANDKSVTDPWLHHLTEYRNTFLHRTPLGASPLSSRLCYYKRSYEDFTIPLIEMPLGKDDLSAPRIDALHRFIDLHRKMTTLLEHAAALAPYPTTPLHLGTL